TEAKIAGHQALVRLRQLRVARWVCGPGAANLTESSWWATIRVSPGGSSTMQMRRSWRWLVIGAGLMAMALVGAWVAFAGFSARRARSELQLAQYEIARGRLEAARRRLTDLTARSSALGGAAEHWLGVCESLAGRPDAALRAFARVPAGYA